MNTLLVLCQKAAPFVNAHNADAMESLGTLFIGGGLIAIAGLTLLKRNAARNMSHEKE